MERAGITSEITAINELYAIAPGLNMPSSASSSGGFECF
jgi:hypothetical protein